VQRFVIACAQLAVEPMAVAANTEKALELTARAVKETGARAVVLPETVTTGFTPDRPVAALWELVDPIPGPQCEPFARAARQLGIYLTFPTYERGPERGVVYNSLALFGPDGALPLCQRPDGGHCGDLGVVGFEENTCSPEPADHAASALRCPGPAIVRG
jgi:predicted amidohydrolase